MFQLLDSIFNGLSIASVLLLAALGLAIVFGLMGVINLAHGELMMLGAYTTFVVQNICQSTPLKDVYILLALPVAFGVAAIAGVILERGIIRFLYGRPLETLLATWGVSLILQQLVRSVNTAMAVSLGLIAILGFLPWWWLGKQPTWPAIKTKVLAVLLPLSGAIAIVIGIGLQRTQKEFWAKAWFSARNVDVTAPAWLRGGVAMGNFQLPYSRIFILVLTGLCVLGIYWFLNRSQWGLRIRAVTQNRPMSACLGIPTDRVDALTFALGSGLAGIAGCAITLLGSVGPNVGQNYIVDTFMVVVIGGVGNFLGTILAALLMGVVSFLIGSGTLALLSSSVTVLQPLTDILNFFATTSMAKVLIFVLIIAFLQFKPAGLFPQKGRTAEL